VEYSRSTQSTVGVLGEQLEYTEYDEYSENKLSTPGVLSALYTGERELSTPRV